MRRALRLTHRWAGLIGALWIIVLGVTGLMLDHRDDWGWAWRTRVPQAMLPDHTVEVLSNRHVTLAQVNPRDTANWVVAGPVGAWRSFDNTATWSDIEFADRSRAPMVTAIVPDAIDAWRKLWLATDDGLWTVDGAASDGVATQVGLAGRSLTALGHGASEGSLVAVENRSDILLWNIGAGDVSETIDADETEVVGLPDKVSWSRFLFDMHLGRSFMNRSWNMAMNDFGAIAMIVLALTGVLAWFTRRRWQRGAGPDVRTRQRISRYLYNSHAPVIGILALFPILYLSLTGIVFDHRIDWMGTLVRNQVDRERLPDVYDFPTLHEEISHVVAYPGGANKLTIGTRLGVLTTDDKGDTWTRETGEPMSPGFVWSLKRHGEQLFLGGLGGPSFVRDVDGSNWSMVPGLRGMPSDATVSDDVWYIISGPSMFVGDLQTGVTAQPFSLPMLDYTPLMLVMFELHNGKIIGTWFRYVLDALAVLLVLMIISGPILWWRRRWA